MDATTRNERRHQEKHGTLDGYVDQSAIVYTRQEAARRLRLSVSMLDVLIKTGRLGHFKAGRRVLLSPDHLAEFLRSIQRNSKVA